jgi:hypothetical protein
MTWLKRWILMAAAVAAPSLACARRGPYAESTRARVVLPPPVFPLKLAPDRTHLVDQTGRPFLVQGDAAWSLIAQPSEAEAETYLADRQSRGVNLVMVNLIEHKFADRAPANAAGQPPFTTAGDFSTPNEAYFAHADAIIRRAAAHGIAVLLAPAYLGFEGAEEGWYREMVAAGPVKMRDWGRYVGARYGAFDNLVWLEAGDYLPPPEGLALVNAVVAGIKEKDGARHLHVPHWDKTSGTEVAVDWADVDSTYTYKPTYLKSLADYNRDRRDGRARAHILIESKYEGEYDSTPRSLRAQAYGALLTGACGQIFGNKPVWNFGEGWQKQLGSPGMVSMTHLWDLLAPRDWPALVPDQTHQVMTAGLAGRTDAEYALLAATPDGRLAVAYLPTVRTVTVDLTKMAGPVRARWFDPASGAMVPAAPGRFPNRGAQALRPPKHNSAGDPDWILLLEL